MDQRQIFLRDVLTVLFKRKSLIVMFLVLVFAVVFVGNYLWPPTYESVAKVRVMRGRGVSQADTALNRPIPGQAQPQLSIEDVNSEMELIYSSSVLDDVVAALGLATNPQKAAGLVRPAVNVLSTVLREVEYVLALKKRRAPAQEAAYVVQKSLDVTPIKDSFVLEVRCSLGSPTHAKDVLQAVLDAYERKHLEVFATPKSSDFFKAQMERVRGELEVSQKELDAFRNENNVVSLDTEKVQLQEQYRDAERLLGQLEDVIKAGGASSGPGEPGAFSAMISVQTDNPVVTEMQIKLDEKRTRRSELAQSKGPKHPDVVGISKEIEDGAQRLAAAVASTKDATDSKIKDIENRLKTINAMVSKLDALDREVRVRGDAYEYYAQKVEESFVADKLSEEGVTNIKVVSGPTMPVNPISPRRLFNLVLAIIVGLVGGVGLAFFIEYLDHGLKTPEDVEHFLKIPPVASFFRSPYEELEPREVHRLMTMLDLILTSKPLQLMEITSSVPGEGSFRVARSVAEAAAQDPDKRVVLVDLAGEEVAVTSGAPGVVDVLTSEVSLEEVLAREGRLAMLGRGSAECPAYLWGSQQMRAFIDGLRQRFDRIIFHVPSVLQSHDSLSLARFADGIVLVIRADSTRREVVQRAVGMLAESKGQVLGAILMDRRTVIPNAVYRRI